MSGVVSCSAAVLTTFYAPHMGHSFICPKKPPTSVKIEPAVVQLQTHT